MGYRDLAKSSGIILVGSVISQVFALLFMIIVTRILSKTDYGYFSYIVSMGTFFATIVSGGIPIAVTRFIAKNPDKECIYIENGLVALILLFVISSIIALVLFWPYWEITVIIFPLSIVNFYLGVIRGRKNFKIYSFVVAGRYAFKLLFLIIVILVGFVRKDVLVWIFAIPGIFILIFAEIIYRLKFLSLPSYDHETFKTMLLFSAPLIVMTTFYSLTANVGIYLLNAQVGKVAVAYYKNSLILQAVYSFISGAIGVVLLPKISSKKSFTEIINIFRNSVIILLLFESAIFIISLILGKYVILFVFSQKYEAVFPLFIVMSLGTIAYSVERAAFSSFWNGIGKPWISMVSSVSAGLLITLLTLFFIPVYGILGAAYGYTVGFILAVVFVDLSFFIYYFFHGGLNNFNS